MITDRDIGFCRNSIARAFLGGELHTNQWAELQPLGEAMMHLLQELVSTTLLMDWGLPTQIARYCAIKEAYQLFNHSELFAPVREKLQEYEAMRYRLIMQTCLGHALSLGPCHWCRKIYPVSVMWVATSYDRTTDERFASLYCNTCKKGVCRMGCRSQRLPCGKPTLVSTPVCDLFADDPFVKLVRSALTGVADLGCLPEAVTIETPAIQHLKEETLEGWGLPVYPRIYFKSDEGNERAGIIIGGHGLYFMEPLPTESA